MIYMFFFFQMLSEGEFDDTEILNLQERANRLLLQEYDKVTVMMMMMMYF